VTAVQHPAPASAGAEFASAAQELVARGHRLSLDGRFGEAEACARDAIRLQPELAIAYNNLGFARQVQGDVAEALACYRRATELGPTLRLARRNLALLLARLGEQEESLALCHAEVGADTDGLRWLQRTVSNAVDERDLKFAGDCAAMLATLRWATPWPGARREGRLPEPLPLHAERRLLSVPKLRHDILQLEYLQRQGLFGDELNPVVDGHRAVLARLSARGEDARAPLDGEDLRAIGDTYNRIIHLRHTPRLGRALSDRWDAARIESRYLDRSPGLVVVDDFLSEDALHEVREFCLESTVWFANRYNHGRLGAFFQNGFNCPLLLQIAEELRMAMPRVIGDRHALQQVWGFKNSAPLPANATTHADFAAVNVNFWITPEDANENPSTGGLVVYDVDAPLHWDFATYNGRDDVIGPFLGRQGARGVRIPYRQNRAVIFNSDLFHGTDEVRFRPEYENMRINITMLYGVREEDHRHLARPDPQTDPGAGAWRSAAFSRARRRAR
jgi:hypothetical protein